MERGTNQFDFDERPWTDRELLYQEYTVKCKNLDEIAEDYPVQRGAIHKWVQRYDLDRIYDHEEWLEQKYFQEDLTTKEVGDLVGVSGTTISNRLKQLGLVQYETEECPQCGEEKESLAKHWNYSDCKHPELSETEKEILTGILMGDASISDRDRDFPRFVLPMTNKEYLEHLRNKFGVLCNNVRDYASSGYSVQRDKRSGFNEGASVENYKDMYAITLKANPFIKELSEWYRDGSKHFPDDLDLTLTTFKNWFVCDGTSTNINGTDYISISLCNEVDNKLKIKKIFSNSVVPNPDNYCINGRNFSIKWNKEKSREIFKMMGEPLPGFEYKWPEDENVYKDSQ